MRKEAVPCRLVSVLVGSLLAAVPAFSQGISGITVETIGATPTPFRSGQALTVSISAKNPSASQPTKQVRAYVSAFKGNADGRLTWLAVDYLGGVSTDSDLPPLAPGEVRTLQFSKALALPPSAGAVIYLVAGAYDPPAEFAQERITAFDLECRGGPTVLCTYKRRGTPVDKWVGGPKP